MAPQRHLHPYMAKGTLQLCLNEGFWDGEMVLGYLGQSQMSSQVSLEEEAEGDLTTHRMG